MPPPDVARAPLDRQRTYQLATVWLLDAVLQLQPFLFTRGPGGFSGMLTSVDAGNPAWIAHSITWNSSIVYHQPILANAAFAGTQFAIAFGIAWRRTCKGPWRSIVWAIGVWWFGEGLGAVLSGGATPLDGGPGAVLFCALLAVLLWPSEGSDRPFVAARTVGAPVAKAIWAVVWALLAVLAVVGSGRSPRVLHDRVADLDVGQPGWLAHLDRSTQSLFLHHGAAAAVMLAVVCLVVAVGVYLPTLVTQAVVALAVAVFAVIWVGTQEISAGSWPAGQPTPTRRPWSSCSPSSTGRSRAPEVPPWSRAPRPRSGRPVAHDLACVALLPLQLADAGGGGLQRRVPAGHGRHPASGGLAHILMGVAMAGMFVPAWAFGPTALWELIFTVCMVRFLVRSVQSVQRFGLHLPHFVIHPAMSLAMLLMYAVPAVGARLSMAMAGPSGRLDPGLATC